MSRNKKYNTMVDCASLGICLREDVARQVDNLVKSLPASQRTLRRKATIPESSELVPGERADISLVSVETVDREGDVVLAKGMQLDLFQRNPVVTFAHQYDQLPCGKCIWIRKVEGGIKAKTQYATRPEDWEGQWLPDAIWALTAQSVISGKSIGFLPIEIRSPTQEEISRNPSWKNAAAMVSSAVLIEYAVAPIPVNQDALVEAVSKGLADRATLQRLGLAVPEKRMTQQQLADLVVREFAKHLKSMTPEAIAKKAMERYRV